MSQKPEFRGQISLRNIKYYIPLLDIHNAYKGTWEDLQSRNSLNCAKPWISETHTAKNPFMGNVVLGCDPILIIKTILNQKNQHRYFPDHYLESPPNLIQVFQVTTKPIIKYSIINHLTPVDGCWGWAEFLSPDFCALAICVHILL